MVALTKFTKDIFVFCFFTLGRRVCKTYFNKSHIRIQTKPSLKPILLILRSTTQESHFQTEANDCVFLLKKKKKNPIFTLVLV